MNKDDLIIAIMRLHTRQIDDDVDRPPGGTG